jgi:hypothetical protein
LLPHPTTIKAVLSAAATITLGRLYRTCVLALNSDRPSRSKSSRDRKCE